jgi:hypothetical protein
MIGIWNPVFILDPVLGFWYFLFGSWYLDLGIYSCYFHASLRGTIL